METAEIIIYKDAQNTDFQIEVRVEDETVWLNRQQMADLFSRDIKTIGKHIHNALREELKEIPVIAKFATTAADGKTYQVEHYNLDMILSVGYRVKSSRGIQFRRWANEILKEYLFRGRLLDHRFERIEKKLQEHDQKFDLIINTGLKPTEGIFYDGQIFDAWQFASGLIKESKHSIILIDNYIDETVLALLARRNAGVAATIFTGKITKQLEADLLKHNAQYPAIEVKTFTKSHDRFLILDQETVYHIGASLKDLGKKWFAFTRINLNATEMINKLNPCPETSGTSRDFGNVPKLRERPETSGTSRDFGNVPRLRESPEDSGKSRGFGKVPRIRESPENSGTSRDFGKVPRLRESPETSGKSREFGKVPRIRDESLNPDSSI